MMKQLKPLYLTQNRVANVGGENVTTWYGWDNRYGMFWTDRLEEATEVHNRGPDYACEVHLPALMFGTPDEIRTDIVCQLHIMEIKTDKEL